MNTPYAVRMSRYGPPDVLSYQPVELRPLSPCEVRIRTRVAAVNHTDLHIRAGDWPVRKDNPFPYTPGVEVTGELVELGHAVTGWAVGDRVITLMQGLGGVRADRPGGYADYVTADASTLARVPGGVDDFEIAALGLGAVTAFGGLKRLGNLKGRRVLVTGAAGGVGSAAIGLARAQGAEVLALVSRSEQTDYVQELGVAEVIVSPREGTPALAAESVDAVLDTVGGRLFPRLVTALRPGGALSLVGAVQGGDVDFDAWQLLKPVIITGYSTEALDGAGLCEAVTAIGDALATGRFHIPRYRIFPMSRASEAHGSARR